MSSANLILKRKIGKDCPKIVWVLSVSQVLLTVCNLCLLEEFDEGFIEGLTGEGESWWKNWFLDIRRWKEVEVDISRVIWVRAYGIHCHG